MKNILNAFLAGMSLLMVIPAVLFSQKVSSYDSHWHTGLTPKDGEEFINKMFYEDKSKFLFYLENDENDLYLSLIVTDRAALQKIMRYGLTTWFNPDGKHKKSLGIQFPVPGNGNSVPSPGAGKPGMNDRKEMMNRMMAGKNSEMVLIGFSGKGNRDTVRIDPGQGIKASVEMMDREKMLISLVVPVKKIESSGQAQPDALLSLGFETGYMDLNQTGMGQSAGSSSPSGGGYGGGMYGGPPPGGGTQPSSGATQGTGVSDKSQGSQGQQAQVPISELAKPNKLWINQVRLAAK